MVEEKHTDDEIDVQISDEAEEEQLVDMMQCAVANDCFKFDADHEFDVQS
jgi:hypothetical protein